MKTIKDPDFIQTLFRNLARQITPVIINNYLTSDLYFKTKKGDIPLLRTSEDLLINSTINVTFLFKDILYHFNSVIISQEDDRVYVIDYPSEIKAHYRRLNYRLNIDSSENVSVNIFNQSYKLSDISAAGLSFISENNCFEQDQIIEYINLTLPDIPAIGLSGQIKYCSNNNDHYIYGIKFLEPDWNAIYYINSYIFSKKYPNVRNMSSCSDEEIYNLYNESGYFNMFKNYSVKQVRQYYNNMLKTFHHLRNKPLILNKLGFYKDKLLAGGDLLWLYKNTYIGIHLAAIPEARRILNSLTDIYLATTDFFLSNKYAQYYLAYIHAEQEWHRKMYLSIGNIIADETKYRFDTCHLFEYDTNYMSTLIPNNNYSISRLREPDQFIDYAEQNLPWLLRKCYCYEKDDFYLPDIKQIYESFNFKINRALWQIKKADKTVAFAVGELFENGLNIYNFMDVTYLYLTEANLDLKPLIPVVLSEVSQFYRANGKHKFNLNFSEQYTSNLNFDIPGLNYIYQMGRVISNKEGGKEYKAIIEAQSRSGV